MANELSLLKPIVEQPDARDYRRDIQRLEDENRKLRRDLEDAISEKDRLMASVKMLRTILSPLHRGLRAVFGEIELAVGEDVTSPASNGTSAASAADPRWDNYKKQFPGPPSEVIDALLIHGDMKLTQLAGLLKRHYNTINDAGTKLVKAGAITRTSGTFSLRR
jgi:hypothetical protein